MIGRFTRIRPRASLYLVIPLAVLAAIVISLYALQQGFSYKELIVVFAALIGAVIVFRGEKGIRDGFVLWVLTLSLGYRTIEVTADLHIHPAELVLWLLLICIFWQRNLLTSNRLALPFWLWLFIPFWALAWWPLVVSDARWDLMLNEFRNFLLLIPLMIVASVVLQQRNYWRLLLLAFFVVSTWVALMGIIEYGFPEITRLFPAFMSGPASIVTREGFARASFSFWGGPVATFICVAALPSAIVLVRWWHVWWHRALIILASIGQIAAIYIGGYRSVWFILVIELLVAVPVRLRRQGALVAVICLVITLGGYQLIPTPASERAISGVQALQGRPIDSSALARKDRALASLDSAIEYPLGNGWASAGWPHSDFLQVAANLGILGGLIFLGGYLYTLWRLARRVLPRLRSGEDGDLGLSLLLSFIAAGGILAMEGVEVLPQLVLPVWFVWVLVEVWLRQTADRIEFIQAPTEVYAGRWVQLDHR
jgi:hypothetical protein